MPCARAWFFSSNKLASKARNLVSVLQLVLRLLDGWQVVEREERKIGAGRWYWCCGFGFSSWGTILGAGK
ncbi:unnamed protein product [Prunus armeniaca]|uniref:Uncharacterized protein n=1 Tax=Prunus armeniaca TaxID=36596 RepID=A0A6J5VPJ5_PRUAR|nr:unnamed protein product [Prunus armeniaca]